MCSESQSRSTVDNWAATHRDAAHFVFLAQIIQAVDKMLVARIDRTGSITRSSAHSVKYPATRVINRRRVGYRDQNAS